MNVHGTAEEVFTAHDRQAGTAPRMSFTEEPSRVWEIDAPAPLEIPEPCHEPAVPELEPASR